MFSDLCSSLLKVLFSLLRRTQTVARSGPLLDHAWLTIQDCLDSRWLSMYVSPSVSHEGCLRGVVTVSSLGCWGPPSLCSPSPFHFLGCLFPLYKLAPLLDVASPTAPAGAVEPVSSWVRLSGGKEVVLAWLSSLTSAWNVLGLP